MLTSRFLMIFLLGNSFPELKTSNIKILSIKWRRFCKAKIDGSGCSLNENIIEF